MNSTQRLRPVTGPLPGRGLWPLAIGVLLAAMIAVDVALVLRPELRAAAAALASELWSSAATSGGALAWVRAGLALGGVGLCALLLVRFVRGVQEAPFAWLAPLLVGFATVVLSRVRGELPLPVSTAAFAVVSGLVVLGGGALVTLRGVPPKLAGALLLLLPLLLLLAGYVHEAGGFARLALAGKASAQLSFFVLTLTALGMAFVALSSPSANAQSRERVARLQRKHQQERARALQAERRSLELEQCLQAQSAELDAALAGHEELAAFRDQATPRLRKLLWPLLLACIAGAAGAGVYQGLYVPLSSRIAAQQGLIAKLGEQHSKALSAARTRFDAELLALRTQHEQARAQHAEALAALEGARKELTALQLAAQPAASEPVKRAPAKRPARVARRSKTASKPEAKAVASPRAGSDAPAAISDDPIAGLEGM